MGPAAQLNILVTANASPAMRSLRQTDTQLRQTAATAQKTTSSVKTFAKGAAGGFGVAAAATGLARATRTFVDFDRAMRNVNSIARLSDKRFDSLSKRVLKLAGPTAQAPKTLAEGLYQLVSSGFEANDAIKVLEKSAIAATAGLTDTATATTVVAAAINSYGLKATDAGRVSDILFKTVDKGVITFEELAQSLGPVLPAANSLNISLEEVGAALATLTKQGFPAAEAATAIDAAMRALLKPSQAMKQAFKDLGVAGGEELIRKYGSLQAALVALRGTTDGSGAAMNKLFNEIRGARGALTLTGENARGAAKDLKALGDASGSTMRAFNEQSKSAAVQWAKLKAQISVVAVTIGASVFPVLTKVLGGLVALQQAIHKSFSAMASFLTNVWKRPLKAFGDLFSSITRGFAKLFDLASHLPGVGGKMGDLRDKANQMAASMDRWGENTREAGGKARGATGRVVNLSKAIAGLPARKQITIDVGLALKTWDKLQSPQQLLGGGGDGWGLESKITSEAQKAAEAKVKQDPSSILGAMPGGGSAGLMGANPILAPFAALGSQFGLSVVSGLRTGAGAITSSGNPSYHGTGHAIDVNAGSGTQMLMYARAMATLFGSRLKELIHTPLGFSIKNGARVAPYAQADHYDHVHVAMQQGGMMVPGSGSGDKVHLQAMVEPGESLFVLNRNATDQLSALHGMNSTFPRFQEGGPVPPLGKPMEQGQARRFVGSVWDQAKALGGKGFTEGRPRVVFGADLGGPTGMVHDGRVSFGKGFLRALAGMPNSLIAPLTDKDGNLIDPGHGRNFALNTVVHEMAHWAQNFSKLAAWEREGGAEAFTQWAAPKIYQALGVSDYGRTPPSYPNYVHRVRGEKSQNWIRHGQFLQRGGLVKGFQQGGVAAKESFGDKQRGWMQSIWDKTAPMFGQAPGSPLPFAKIRFGNDIPFVGFSQDPGAKDKSKGELLWPKWLVHGGDRIPPKARDQLFLHELAHRFQSDKETASYQSAEGGAEAFGRWGVRNLLGEPTQYTGSPYAKFVKNVVASKGWGWVLGGQFGRPAPAGYQRGGVVGVASRAKGGLLDGLNKVYPATSLSNRGAALTEQQVRAVAEAWGGLTPPRAYQAMQISKGESAGFHPGIIGDDAAAGYGNTFGIGLWQITRGVQGALGKQWIDSRGGDTGMRNPKKNAEVMSLLSGEGTSWSNWYGTAYLGPLQENVQSVFGAGGAESGGKAGKVKRKPRKLTQLFTKIRGIEMPSLLGPTAKQLQQRIDLLTEAGTIYGDYASRAEALSDSDKGIVGQAFGKDQIGWLNEQLGVLFELRNTLIDAEAVVVKHRDAFTRTILDARTRLEKIGDDIQEAAARRRDRVTELEKERKRPKPNKLKVAKLRGEIEKIDRNQAARVAERKSINGVLPDWVKSRKGLNDQRGELLTTLEGVQGPGSPMVRLRALPQMGVLGGEIFQVQQSLVGAQERITDSSTPTTDDSGRADLLAQLLRESNLRAAVADSAFKTITGFKIPGVPQFMGAFAKGGIALVGEKGPELAHMPSGTRVHSASDTQQMMQPTVNISVALFEGENKALVTVNGQQHEADVRRMARTAGRRLPSQGGGLT